MENKQLPGVHEFFINTSLYDAFPVSDSNKKELFELLYYAGVIDNYCPECGQKSVFRGEDNRPKYSGGHMHGHKVANGSYWEINLIISYLTVAKVFVCTRHNEHNLTFYIRVKNEMVQKIGQFPSVADLNSFGISKFKKILGKELYSEFNRAIGLFSHGIGVGSFVYLRRIMENFIITPAYEMAKLEPGWNEEAYGKLRVAEKIKELKKFLPNYLVQNAALYSIISKGIHELTEEECKAYFPVLRECMEYVLTELQAQKEMEEKKKELTQMIGKIAGQLK